METTTLPPLRNYYEVRQFLFGLRNTGTRYGIERMERLAKALGDPHTTYPVIHVAGTNGKGSTCAMLEGIFRKAGYKTGLYTSPHLIRLNERIQVNRTPIPDEAIVALTRAIVPIGLKLEAEDPGMFPSFFEFMTASAFLHFMREKVDVAIIEVGLGGRLDATNVVTPLATAITSIGFDHMNILGNTLAQIAGEKAGIIKSGVPVVVGDLPPEAMEAVHAKALALGAPIARPVAGVEIARLPETNLQGSFQRKNAALAQAIVESVRSHFPIPAQTVAEALKDVQWRGRWDERALPGGTTLILDATHNEEGAVGLAENLSRWRGTRFPIVAGILGRDRAEAILPVLAEYASELFWVTPDQPRASQWEEIADLWPASIPVNQHPLPTLFSANRLGSIFGFQEKILVTGSLYLLGEVYTLLEGAHKNCDPDLQDDLMSRK